MFCLLFSLEHLAPALFTVTSVSQAEAHERLEQVKAYVVAASRQLEHQRSQVGGVGVGVGFPGCCWCWMACLWLQLYTAG